MQDRTQVKIGKRMEFFPNMHEKSHGYMDIHKLETVTFIVIVAGLGSSVTEDLIFVYLQENGEAPKRLKE